MKSKNKDKQIREFIYPINIWKGVAIIFIILSFAMVLGDTFIWNYGELKEELQSCQEKVPVWTMEIKCKFHNVSTTSYERNEYNSYAEYERELKKFEIDREYFIKQDWKTCEVISEEGWRQKAWNKGEGMVIE